MEDVKIFSSTFINNGFIWAVMAPRIGISTVVLGRKWFDQLGMLPTDVVEVSGRYSKFEYDYEWVLAQRKRLEGFDVSVHSGTNYVFSSHPLYTQTELYRLRSEVLTCHEWGASHLVFHLKNGILGPKEEAQLKDVAAMAGEYGTKLVFESNSSAEARLALDFLDRFPNVGYNLDMGHLYHGFCNGRLGMGLDEFVASVRDRTVYVHAHSNDGRADQHISIDRGNLDWEHVLDSLDRDRLEKVIVEVRDFDGAFETYCLLNDYFNKSNK